MAARDDDPQARSDPGLRTPRLKPAAFHILLALAARPAHGYAIMRSVGEQSGGQVRLGTGPFYRHLARLLDAGLVDESRARPADHDSRRGAYYRLSAAGRKALAAESRRLAGLVSLTRELGLLPERGS